MERTVLIFHSEKKLRTSRLVDEEEGDEKITLDPDVVDNDDMHTFTLEIRLMKVEVRI